MYGGQSSKGFLVDHHLLLSKQRNDNELNWGIVENQEKKLVACPPLARMLSTSRRPRVAG